MKINATIAIELFDDQKDELFVELLKELYEDYGGSYKPFADNPKELRDAAKTLLRLYMIPSEYEEYFHEKYADQTIYGVTHIG